MLGTTTRHPAVVLIAPFCSIFSYGLLAAPIQMVRDGRLEPWHALPVFAPNGLAVLLELASVLMMICGRVIIEVRGVGATFFMGPSRIAFGSGLTVERFDCHIATIEEYVRVPLVEAHGKGASLARKGG